MAPDKVQIVQQSLGRCILNHSNPKSFLDAFYDEFLASDPRIKPLFAKTDMEKQKSLLRQGLMMLIMYGNGTGLAKTAIENLALKHNHEHLNIDPGLYRFWLKSLLTCVKKYDPKYDDQLNQMWLDVLDTGISAMKKAY